MQLKKLRCGLVGVFRELRTYISAIAAIPILIMLLNPVVLDAFMKFLGSLSSIMAMLMIFVYLVFRSIGLLSSIKSILAQALIEIFLLVAPILYPLIPLMQTGNPFEFTGTFMLYLILACGGCLYQVIIGKRVGAAGKVSYFTMGYLLSMMIYAGSLAGSYSGEGFSLLLAFDQIAGAAVILGYPSRPLFLPLYEFVKLSMALAIPAVTFSALAAQVRVSELKENPTGDAKMGSSLRLAVAVLTLSSSVLLLPSYLVSLRFAENYASWVTVVPPMIVAIFVLFVYVIVMRRE